MTWALRRAAFDVGRQTLQDGVEDTASLTSRHHVDVQIRERLRVFLEGVGERRPGLDVLADLQDDVLESLVFLLLAQDLQALDER